MPSVLLASLYWIHCPQALKAEALPHPDQRLAQAQIEQAPVLGVVKTNQDAAQWQEMTDRLDQTGIVYRVIDWSTVQRTTSFDGITVLFLPNVEVITSNQLLGLQAWLNRGGRIIVSGAVGSQSSSGVQNALRSLLGAYWASNFTQPQPLQPLQIASQRWVRHIDTTSTVIGGVVVPTSLASQPVAVWGRAGSASAREIRNGAAVVVTQKSTFLGWQWGDPAASTAALDSSWLRATVDRFQDTSSLRPAPVAAAASPRPSAITATPPSQRPALQSVPPSPQSSPQSSPQPLPQPLPQSSPQPSSQPSPQSLPAPRSSNRRLDVTRLLNRSVPTPQPTATQDPAEQVAPPVLTIERNTRITLHEATTLRQELENLMGRYESALILAHSQANRRISETAQPAVKTESAEEEATRPASTRSSSLSSPSPIDDDILSQARQGYVAFSEAMAQQDYSTARQQWLTTRQLLQDHFPLDQRLAQPEVRAMWLDRGTIVRAGSRRGLAQIFDRLAAAGINTVFFETVNAGYPIYPSQVAPEQNPLTRHWDPLAEAVDLAHARGMELHAWVWTFAAGNQVHNALLNQPVSYPGPILSAHPDWANSDNRGALIPPGQTKPFLDPANPAVRSYLLNLFQEIVTRYDVDGLQLDYIRYPFQDPRAGGHTYGYGMAARQQFHRLTGVDPITLSPSRGQSQLWQQWTEFRTEQINSFVAETSRLLHRLQPDLIFSTAVFALPERRRVNEIQQNWEMWAQQGHVDMIVLMSYASDANGLQRLVSPWLSGSVDLGSTLVLPGIRLLNLPDGTVVDQIQSLRDSSSGGFALFAAENLNSRLQNIFHQIQGEDSAADTDPIPYRQPFAAASSRYRILLQQWNWLLDNGHLQMTDQQLETWRTKTSTLEQALQTLAADPSNQNLQQARTLLKGFQNQFKAWMDLPTLNENYRVSTWQSQLATLERLLRYGERVVLTRQSSARQATR